MDVHPLERQIFQVRECNCLRDDVREAVDMVRAGFVARVDIWEPFNGHAAQGRQAGAGQVVEKLV